MHSSTLILPVARVREVDAKVSVRKAAAAANHRRLLRRESLDAAAMAKELQWTLEDKAHQLYRLCDAEGRGLVTKRDMRRLSEHLPLSPIQLDQVFDTLDEDGNGFLTLQEFVRGFGQFSGSDNEVPRSPMVLTNGHGHISGRVDIEDMENEEDQQQQFQEAMEQLLGGNGSIHAISEDPVMRELWWHMKRENPELVPALETLLQKVSSEMNQTRTDYRQLQLSLRTVVASHEEELRRLETEMEEQIRVERERLLSEERAKERQIREELEREIRAKDQAYQDLAQRQEELRARLDEINSMHSSTKEENERLAREKEELEEQLEETQVSLEDSQIYIEELNQRFKDDRRQRARAALEVSEGIAQERESLVRQLDMLREMNRRLKDQRDESVALSAHNESSDGESLGNLVKNDQYKIGVDEGETLGDLVCGLGAPDDEEDDCEYDDNLYSVEKPIEPVIASSLDTKSIVDTSIIQESPQRVFKVVFVGDSGVGKSCIIQRFCRNSFVSSFTTTIGIDFQVKSMKVGNQVVALQLWDTAGQERYRSITKQYFRKADGVAVVYDITDEQSFLSVRRWMDSVDQEAVVGESPVRMLLGNKLDLVEPDPTSKTHAIPAATSTDAAGRLATTYDALCYQVSAKTGAGVTEAFQALGRLLTEREDRELKQSIQVKEPDIQKTCCGN